MSIDTNSNHTIEIEIGGEKITAEYFESNLDLNFGNNGSWFFKLHDLIVAPYYTVKRLFRNCYYEVYYGFERMFKGYDNVDCFETFLKFTTRYYKILSEYKRSKISYHGAMSKDEWDGIIDKMLFHLYFMDENNVDKELKMNVPEGWIPTCKTSNEIMNKHKDEFFKLFSMYFYDLWD